MKSKRLILICLLLTNLGFSQTIVADRSFNIQDTTADIFLKGIDGDYRAIRVQTDGKILIGGSFTRYNEVEKFGIARLNQDGSLDPTFIASTEYPGGAFSPGTVTDIAIQPDGKILISGEGGGNYVNGIHQEGISRLNQDGSLDNTFNVGQGSNNTVNRIYLQPDGKIILIGLFVEFNLLPHNYIVRLNSDGSVDNSFQIPTGFFYINDIAIQADGKILIASSYSDPSNTVYKVPMRLNSNGSIDNSFSLLQTTNTTNTSTHSLALQQNGKILVGGNYTNIVGIGNYNHFVRLNSDGSIDNTFNAGTGPNSGVGRIQVNSMDEILITPTDYGFENYDGHQGTVAYLNSDGSYKPMFDGSCVTQGTPSGIRACFASNGNILYTSDIIYELNSLRVNGALDPTFNCQTGVGQKTNVIVEQADGKLMVGGIFATYNGKACSHLARLNPDGTMDSIFNVNIGFGPMIDPSVCSSEIDNEVYSYNVGVNVITIQPDGKYLIGGNFQYFNGVQLNSSIVRLNTDGTLDTGFESQIDNITGDIRSIHVQPDGKILLTIGGAIYRLYPDGFIDNTYSTGVNSIINSSVRQPDGRVVIVGNFILQNNPYYALNHISRRNANGSIDNLFLTNTGSGAGGLIGATINSVILQPDGKLFLAGYFSTFNGVPCQSRIRLNSDGTVDTTFHVTTGDSIVIHSAVLGSDGKFLLGGNFDPTQEELTGVMKIDQNGDVDSVWSLEQSCYRYVSNLFGSLEERMAVALQADGKVLVGGRFTSFNGITRNGIVRLVECQPIYATQNVTEQFSYIWPVNGVTYTTSGQFIDTMPNLVGCDSIVTLNLTITEMSITCFTSPSYVDSCNGVVNLSAGGTPNFTFDLGNGSTVTSSGYAVFDSLCPGVYSLLVTDGNGDTLNTTFVVPSDSTYILVDPFGGVAATDSTAILIENCDIDYNSIDSVYIDSYTILTGDSVLINWAVLDINGITIIPSILVLTPGNIYTQLQLYCSTKSIDKYFVATIGINYDGNRISTLGLKDMELDLFTIYPNPTNDQVHISFSGLDAELTVYDVQGKVVLKDKIQNQGIISLQNFERGVYLFDFKNSQGHSVQRVVKQ